MQHHIAGTWHNQHGSEVEFATAEDGRISGMFRSGTGLAKGTEACDVTGFVCGDLITFTANFGRFGSVTAWTGHLVWQEGEPVLETQWQMAIELPRPGNTDELWKGVWTGSDFFRRGSARSETKPSLRVPSHPLPEWP